ncbi:MAG: nucleotide exchange factor GrpE [Desulfobacterales bacterium]|nr:nucleotide exchange factor GrpE [Desulfobacterales bacterium]
MDEMEDEEFNFGIPIKELAKIKSDPITSESGVSTNIQGDDAILNPDERLQEIETKEGLAASTKEVTKPIILKMEQIQEQLSSLQREFQSKLKYDAHKDKIIDQLHQELQEYKKDIVKKYLKSFIMDVIKIIDDIRKLVEHYRSKEASAIDLEKLLKVFENIPSDLEDLFYWQGVKPFTCNKATFDPGCQRVMKTIETADKSKDKTVAESLRPGYEWDGKVIRPEMVAVYSYILAPIEV